MTRVTLADGSVVDVDMNDDVVAPAVDASGVWLGLVQLGEGVHQVPCAPPVGDGWTWNFAALRWERAVLLEEAQAAAREDIDRAAGVARLRYITDVPGQQAVYLQKESQCRAYAAAGFSGTVPPLVQTEADIDGTGAQTAAEKIIAIADAWAAVSALIEGARLGGKRAVDQAIDTAGVQTARDGALSTLAGL